MRPEKDLDKDFDKDFDYVTFLKNVPLWLFLPYLEDEDFRALAMCCRVGAEKVKKLEEDLKKQKLAFRNPRPMVLSRFQGYHDIELKSPPIVADQWHILDIALPANGKWLFVLHVSSPEMEFFFEEMLPYCLDIYRQESESPLRYAHEKRCKFFFSPEHVKPIIRLDNNPENPGIYLWASSARSKLPGYVFPRWHKSVKIGVYSFHLQDKQPVFVQGDPMQTEDRWFGKCVFSENKKIVLELWGKRLRQPLSTRAVLSASERKALRSEEYSPLISPPHPETMTLLCERSTLRFHAPLIMARIEEERSGFFGDFYFDNLRSLANRSLLWQILLLAQDSRAYAEAKYVPQLAGLCALARSEFGLLLVSQGVAGFDVQAAKNQAVPTQDLGTINTNAFFWVNKRTSPSPARDNLDKTLLLDLMWILHKRGVVYFIGHGKTEFYDNDPLVFQSIVVEHGIRVIDVCCQSRHETYDKKHKKLIPKSFSKALQRHERLRNYLALDALLIKLISWLPEQEAKTLESARLRMNDAVAANPSLRFDPVQLLSVRFYRQRNIISAISDPHYRDLIAEHLAPGHDFTLNIEIDEAHSEARPRQGF